MLSMIHAITNMLTYDTYNNNPSATSLLDMYLIRWVDLGSLEKSPELSTRRVDVIEVRHDRNMHRWN